MFLLSGDGNDHYGAAIAPVAPFAARSGLAVINQPLGAVRPELTCGFDAGNVACEGATDNVLGKVFTAGTMSAETGHIQLGTATYQAGTERIVTASGDEVLLRSQSALVLRFLVERLGQLATRDDLIDHVWPDVAVTDDSLTQCISDIRRAIGDTKRDILKTVPKRGYILHGTLQDAPDSPLQVVTSAHALAGADTLSTLVRIAENPGAAGPTITPQLDPRDVLPTLAVLPFRAQADSANGSVMSMFLGDEIARAVSRSEDMNVISRLSTIDAGERGNVRDMGRMLNSDFVLSGSVLEVGQTIILMVEFADANSQLVLWSDRMALPMETWLTQADCIDDIVTHIRRAIMTNEVRRARSAPLSDLKLFSVLHGAVGLMHRFALEDFNRAQRYLDYVIEQAPTHPTPLAWLARWHVLCTVQGWANDPQEASRTALDLTARALDIDPNHTMALVCEGQVLGHLAHRLDEAQSRYDTALANSPNDAQGRALRGMLHAFQDRGTEGTRDAERALHLTPLDPHRFFYLALAAGANLSAENFPRAVTLAKESLRLNRTHFSTMRMLAVAQQGAGLNDDARATAQELLTLQPKLRVSDWLSTAPSAQFENGKRFAQLMRDAGIPK